VDGENLKFYYYYIPKMSRAYKAILLRDKENDFTNRNDHPGDS
jgi:hypothetical protein